MGKQITIIIAVILLITIFYSGGGIEIGYDANRSMVSKGGVSMPAEAIYEEGGCHILSVDFRRNILMFFEVRAGFDFSGRSVQFTMFLAGKRSGRKPGFALKLNSVSQPDTIISGLGFCFTLEEKKRLKRISGMVDPLIARLAHLPFSHEERYHRMGRSDLISFPEYRHQLSDY